MYRHYFVLEHCRALSKNVKREFLNPLIEEGIPNALLSTPWRSFNNVVAAVREPPYLV